MEIRCSSNKLSEGLQLISNVITTSTTKPVLQAVKLETVGNMLEMSGTDLEVGIRYLVQPEKIDKQGSVVLPAGRLMGLLREWPEEEVSLKAKEATCHISGKGCSFKLVGYDPAEFPVIPSFKEEGYFEIDAEKIGEVIKRTAFACASERLRHTMTGVLLDVSGEEIKMVATDGRRMAYSKEKVDNKGGVSCTSIVPLKGIHQIPKIAAYASGPVKIKLEETYMMVKTDNAMLYSQLIEGQYPNYADVIPKEAGEKITIDSSVLAAAVRRVAFLTTEERHVVRLKFQKGSVVVSAETPEVGEGEIGLDAEYTGKDVELGINPDFLLDALKALGDVKVKLAFKDGNTAVTLKVGRDYVYVLMPIRLSE
jgi:DNA polymerase-3 subunit beta